MKKIIVQNKTLILILFFLIFFCTNAYALKKKRHGSQCHRNQLKVIDALIKLEQDKKNLIDYSKGFDFVINKLVSDGFLDEHLDLEDRENCKYRFEYKGNPDTFDDSKYFIEYYDLFCEYHGSADGRIKPSKEFQKFLRDSEINFIIWYYTVYEPLPLLFLLVFVAIIVTFIFIFQKKKKE